jgi:hypothetical protein
MKHVLDSSVALKWVLPEPDSGTALRLLDETNKAIHELIAPDIPLLYFIAFAEWPTQIAAPPIRAGKSGT